MRDLTSFAVRTDLREWWNAQPGPQVSPFLRWEWFSTWVEAFLPKRSEVRILVVDAGGAPAAAVALSATGRSLASLSNAHTPRFDAVYDPAHPQALDELSAAARRAPSLRLIQVPADSAFLHSLDFPRLPHVLLGTQDSPYADLRGTAEELLASRSRNLRQLVRRRSRQLDTLGTVSLDVVSGCADLHGVLTEGFDVEASGWKGRAGTAITSRASTERFYRRLADVAVEHGWLRLFTLRVEGRPVAFAYHLLYANRLHLLKTGFVEDLGSGHAPGLVLTWRVLEWCIANGLDGYEFLGAAERWKTDWTNGSRPYENVAVYRASPLGRVRAILHARMHEKAVTRRRRAEAGAHAARDAQSHASADTE